ncbi:MAG: hypothetical protein J5629_09635 [Muribaculaceae bacterium]|nr:hypothetical protein [Muribaculaceae bacterium]
MGYYINSTGDKIDGSEYRVEHPEGMIQLLDGTVLPCYEKDGEADIANDKEDETRLCKLFTDNAFYLLAHRERILSDSRMFLTPVTVQSGLAYTGTSGFRNPTVGVYLEWWLECPQAMVTDDSGRSLIFKLAGSPLSGMNHCSCVDMHGGTHIISVRPFYKFWKPFMGINIRYNAAKRRYRAYSLKEVLEILNAEDNGNKGNNI